MVLHHTGSEGELLFCSTPCLSVTIKGADLSSPFVQCDQKEASLKIVCDDDYEVTLSGDAEMAFSQSERATLPRGIESKLKKVDWSQRDVLIGPLRRRKQLQICLDNNFYYVPANRLAEERLPIHEVAVYQSIDMYGHEAGIEYYGEVISLEKVKRREITEIPKDSDQLYYRLNVREWKRLDRRIEAKESGMPVPG